MICNNNNNNNNDNKHNNNNERERERDIIIYTRMCVRIVFFGMFWLPPKVETHGKPQSLVSMVKHEYQIEKRDRERERECRISEYSCWTHPGV